MNLHPVDVRRELRQGVQRRFDLAPVVIFLPITREFAHRRELHALRCICHRFQLRPLCRGDPPAEVRQRFVGHGHGTGRIDESAAVAVAAAAPGARGHGRLRNGLDAACRRIRRFGGSGGRRKKDCDRSDQGGGRNAMAPSNRRVESGHDHSPSL